MPRQAREKSNTGVYHIMIRGINRQDIFQDDEDRSVYLDRLARYKNERGFEIYAFCLMDNHVHMLIKDSREDVSAAMKKIEASYAYWYNWKYNRTGHLFQDRFKSEPVENDEYLLTAARYIHQNPVKVGLGISHWTSYNDYINGKGFSDTKFILSLFSYDITEAKKAFIKYMNESNQDECLELNEQKRLSDADAKNMILEAGRVSNCQALQDFERINLDAVLRKLKEDGLSIRQLERLTGLNRGIILKA